MANLKKLDLGCGLRKIEGAIGIDRIDLPTVDIVHDLDQYPYPFDDNSFDEIYLMDVIEHLEDVMAAMEEIHRIGKNDAKVIIRVVNWNHRFAATDPTHKHFFTEESFDFFGKRKHRAYYSEARFDVVKVEYIWDRTINRLHLPLRLRKLLSRYLCNILQAFVFELRIIKT